MGGSGLLQIGAALLSGSTLPFVLAFLWRRLRRDLKAEAETRKLNVEADGLIVQRLYAEIDRLDHEMKEVRAELNSVRTAAHFEKLTLENENKELRTQVGRLRRRVDGLEKILKVKPLTAEDKAILAELDRTTESKP